MAGRSYGREIIGLGAGWRAITELVRNSTMWRSGRRVRVGPVGPPDRIQRQDVSVMGLSSTDELSSIQQAWPWFEQLVGPGRRKMFAQINESAGTHTVCTPVTSDDRPERLGLSLAERSTTSTSRSFLKGTTSASGCIQASSDRGTGPTRRLHEYRTGRTGGGVVGHPLKSHADTLRETILAPLGGGPSRAGEGTRRRAHCRCPLAGTSEHSPDDTIQCHECRRCECGQRRPLYPGPPTSSLASHGLSKLTDQSI